MNIFEVSFEDDILSLENLIDYRQYQKQNTLSLQSKEYVNWRSKESKSVFFSENVYGWKNNDNYVFDGLLDEIFPIMQLFDYEK